MTSICAWSQQRIDEDQLKEANALFDDGQYLNALEVYRQLLSVSPESQLLNFKYGACLIYTDEDTQEPVKYLRYGATQPDDPTVFYFLGKALHLNYQFADAQQAYAKFSSLADEKLKKKYSDAQQLIKMTKNGQSLLSQIKDIVVLDKTEASSKEFFRSYNTDDIGGKIIVTPDDILSKKDKSSGENSLIFFQSENTDIYYSSYGDEDQRDIYKVTRLENGKYTKPKKLSIGVNSAFDENYPFMHPDGQTLYFSSKGHNSMGGYDIFKSILDPNTGEFGPAVNLDFAISSPDDDLFYIADLNKQYAFFASGRSSELGRLNVYHVRVKAGSANLSVIKGSYIDNDINKPITIRVEDALTNKEVGAFKSDPNSGEYIINLPKGGKYKFYVEEDGSNTIHSGIFEVPRSKGTVAYAQEMTFTKINGVDQLILNNLFDEPLDDDVSALIAESLRRKAALDINKDEFVEEDATEDLESAFEAAGFAKNLSNETLKEEAQLESKKYAESSTEDIEDANLIFAYALKKQEEAKDLLDLSVKAFNQANSEIDQTKKEELLLEAAWNKHEANKKNEEGKNALALLKKIDKNAKEKYERYQSFDANVSKIEKSSEEADFDNLVNAFETHRDLMKMSAVPGTMESIEVENQEKRRQSSRALDFAQKIDAEKKDLKDRLQVREKQLEKAEKKREIETLTLDVAGMKEELADYDVQSKGAYSRYETRLNDQKNSEDQGRLFAEHQLKKADSEWANLQPIEYSDASITEFEQKVRFHKRTEKSIKIDDIEISQLLAKRTDLSHRFDFGEIVRDAGEVSVENERVAVTVPDELEFVEEENSEESLVVIDQEIETEDDYQMFLINSKSKENPTEDWDLKIKKYEELKENASPEQIVLLDQRIEGITELKSERMNSIVEAESQAKLLEDIRPETISLADKEFDEEMTEELTEWISPSYAVSKKAILDSEKTPVEKKADYQNLNAEFASEIDEAKTELMNIYSINRIAGTTKSMGNLKFLDDLKLSVEADELTEIELITDELPAEELTTDESPTVELPTEELPLEESSEENNDPIVEEITEESNELGSTADEVLESNTDTNDLIKESPQISTDPGIFFDESKSLDEVEKVENSDIAKVNGMTQENDLRLKLIEESDSDALSKTQERLAYNDLYLSALKIKQLSNFNDVDGDPLLLVDRTAENDAIEKLIASTELEMQKDKVQLADMIDMDLSSGELNNSSYKDNYLSELDEIQSSDGTENERVKQQILLDNMVAFSLEKDIKLNNAKLADPNISVLEKGHLEAENEKFEKRYESIRITNKVRLAKINTSVSEEDVFDRQQERSYLPDNFFRKTDYTELIEKTGYKEVDLYYPEAKALQEVANRDLIILETNKRDLESVDYRKKEIEIGEKLKEANGLEYGELEALLSEVNYDGLSHRELATKAEGFAVQATKWNRSAESLEQLSANAIGDQKNELLKELIASQMNAIEYSRHALAIVNYLGEGKDGDQFVFSDFVVPNKLLAPLQANTNMALSEEIFQDAYVGYNYLPDETLANTEPADRTVNRVVNETDVDQSNVVVNPETTEPAEETNLSPEDEISDIITETEENVSISAEQEVISTVEETTETVTNVQEETTETIDVTVPNVEETPIDIIEEVTDETIEETFEESVTASVFTDTTRYLNEASVSPELLQQATIRLNQESVKPSLKLNENGVVLSTERAAIVRNISGKSDKEKAVESKSLLIDQIKEMMVDQIEIQQVYSENLYQKEQGLVVVKESIENDGETDILIKEHNRLVAEIKQLKNFDSNAKSNVLDLDDQLDREERLIVELRKEVEEEKAIAEFVTDEELAKPNIPEVLTSNIFVRSTGGISAYSEAEPIPIDPVMPEGIIYQVQVGAYRQPIPQDLFKGFTPIMGQKIQSGITRYKVGLFTTYNVANAAKIEIRELGYTDAFVVVFNNGNKISINEARILAGEIVEDLATDESNTSSTEVDENNITGQASGTDSNTTDPTNGTGISELSSYTFVEDETKDDYYNDVEAAEATQVEMIKGLFYTVQIGAYSNPVASDKLFGINPLNTELTKTGLIRYTTGIYKEFDEVNTYKETVRSKGLSDAFVSAYYNGYRITLSKAKELSDAQGESVWIDPSNVNKGSSTSSQVESQNPSTSGNTEATKESVNYGSKEEVLDAANSIIESGLPTEMVWQLLEEQGMLDDAQSEDNTFKVILGPFEEAIPTREVEIILNFRDNIQFEERGENAYVYSSINPIPYAEARKLKETLEEEGLTTAKIVSFRGSREISMEEFLKGLSE